MKAFIFVALVASVAARSLDLDTLRLAKERTLLTRPVVDDLLLKEKLGQRLPVEKTMVGDVIDRVLPVEQKQLLVDGQEQLLRGIYDVDRVLTFEEIYNTELFREYLTIPLFREYIQYPVFQRYVASVYFQRFWQIPTFRQYFLNPVYFYKYIYPLVQLFTNEYTLPYQYQQQQSIYGQDVYGQQDIFGRQSYDDLIVKNKNVLPYVYGQQDVISSRYGLPTYAGQYYPTTTQGVNYKFLLEKLYRNLLVKPVVGDVTEVKTDVKVFPTTQKVVVEPITGERQVVDEPRIVDVKVNEQVVPVQQLPIERREVPVVDTLERQLIREQLPVERQLIREQLPIERQLVREQLPVERRQFPVVDTVERQLIREQLLKDLVKEKYLTPEVYQTIARDIPTIVRDIPTVTRDIPSFVRDIPTINREGRQSVFDTVDTVGRREVYTPYVNRLVQGERYNLINKLYNQLYNQEIPAVRENTVYDRLPIQQVLGNNFA